MFTLAAPALTRRGFLQACSLGVVYFLMSSTSLDASFSGLVDTMREAKTAKVHVISLGSDLYVIENNGGNITVLDGPDGKLMVQRMLRRKRQPRSDVAPN